MRMHPPWVSDDAEYITIFVVYNPSVPNSILVILKVITFLHFIQTNSETKCVFVFTLFRKRSTFTLKRFIFLILHLINLSLLLPKLGLICAVHESISFKLLNSIWSTTEALKLHTAPYFLIMYPEMEINFILHLLSFEYLMFS